MAFVVEKAFRGSLLLGPALKPLTLRAHVAMGARGWEEVSLGTLLQSSEMIYVQTFFVRQVPLGDVFSQSGPEQPYNDSGFLRIHMFWFP